MKILHVISSMSANSGGPAVSTLLPVRYLYEQGKEVKILTFHPLSGETVLSNEAFIRYLPELSGWQRRSGYSPTLKKSLWEDNDTDIFHIQGLWLYPAYITARMARCKKKPYIITLRGMLYPQALEESKVIKKLALSFYQRRQLQQAACVQVTCDDELRYYRELGFTNPVALIPNPVEIESAIPQPIDDEIKCFGYLGRIHPRKHIERLIDCWQRLGEPGELVIMGDGERNYVNYLKDKVRVAQLKCIRFTGWMAGIEKKTLLSSISCLVVPSDFENFGRIIPEALVQEIPVIASTGTPWKELNLYQCGWWVNNDFDTLTETIQEVSMLDKRTLKEMGARGRRLVLDKYSVDAVSGQMELCYKWLMGEVEKPDFVFLK